MAWVKRTHTAAAQICENPEGALAGASTLSGFRFEVALQQLRSLSLGTSPIPGSGSGGRLLPFGLGAPPEGARSEPASRTVAGPFGPPNHFDDDGNVRHRTRRMQAQGLPRFRVSAILFAGCCAGPTPIEWGQPQEVDQ